MYICLCNPFSDKDVRKYLDEHDDEVAISEVYRCCSGGETPSCGTCVPTLREMVLDHNSRVAVKKIGQNLKKQDA
jgi:bacterioferritin-associated ferredoxin